MDISPHDTLSQAYDLVVIGASAGGIEALSTIVSTLPPTFPAAIVIAQHLDPNSTSHLGSILARRTSLPVHALTRRESIAPGVIFVVPADHDVEIIDQSVNLIHDDQRRPKPSINRLFRSAARAYGERLIGIILTGSNSDGASGARDIKAAGGMVIIENPATAAHAAMPLALSPTIVDMAVDLAQIGPLLADLVSGTFTADSETVLPLVLNQLREHSQIDFSSYKRPTILRRLHRRLVSTGTNTLPNYLRYLDDHPDEYQQLLASFLINVTEFFRDPEFFAVLRERVLPTLIAHARQSGIPVRCWSAGCATGEEAYSLAILFAEVLGDEIIQMPVRIFATDLDADAIAFARRGVYPASTVAELPEVIATRYFIPLDGAYEVSPLLRSLIVFGQHDLGQRAPFPHIDLVLCRNVLIYFTTELQQRALQLFAFALRDGGYLVLGKAETPHLLKEYFTAVHSSLKLYQRQGGHILVPPIPQSLALSTATSYRERPMKSRAAPQSPRSRTSSEKMGALVLGLSQGAVAVDRRYDIQAINAAAQHMLGIFRAALGEDLIHLMTQVPTAEVRAVIDAAFLGDTSANEVTVATTTSEPRYLQIAAYRQASEQEEGDLEYVLLWITDVTAQVQAKQHASEESQRRKLHLADDTHAPYISRKRRQQRVWEAERRHLQEGHDRLVADLEQMKALNRTLVAANQELVNANLALAYDNEDIFIRNEELQASTEEIKTLNEEMQATNEELETLNEEMEATNEELRSTNEDLLARTTEVQQLATLRETQRQASELKAIELAAILRSMGDALLVLNQMGEVLFTNDAYLALFGSSTAEFVTRDEYGQPLPDAEQIQQRVARGDPFRVTFTLSNTVEERRWLEATGEPVRVDETLRGGVVTLRDITDRSLYHLQNEFLSRASHELRNPLTAIMAATQMIERKWATKGDRTHTLLLIILHQTQRLKRLISDLVDVSRLQSNKLRLDMATIDISEVARHAVDVVALTMPSPSIILDAQGSLVIEGDAVRVEQIFTNLLTNACTYAPDTEQIMMRLRQVEDTAEIQIQDTGPGIPAPSLPFLFQRFYQAAPNESSAQRGLGLGLFITHELVVAHGGSIHVASTIGQGTTFTVRFLLSGIPYNE
jgi:two-component system, chemotaxis family, CheB/CheR fusion protein